MAADLVHASGSGTVLTLLSAVVNGKTCELSGPPSRSVLALLRDDLGLTGTKPGCGEGECGACTVLHDGVSVLACQAILAEVAGRSVTTIEGLARGRGLHPVQRALAAERASQCGYCTPGMALRAAALLTADPDAGDGQIAAALEPNVCRCGCDPRIARAVRRAAVLPGDSGQQPPEPAARSAPPGHRPAQPPGYRSGCGPPRQQRPVPPPVLGHQRQTPLASAPARIPAQARGHAVNRSRSRATSCRPSP